MFTIQFKRRLTGNSPVFVRNTFEEILILILEYRDEIDSGLVIEIKVK